MEMNAEDDEFDTDTLPWAMPCNASLFLSALKRLVARGGSPGSRGTAETGCGAATAGEASQVARYADARVNLSLASPRPSVSDTPSR
jgi:hypothetical protein